MVDVGSLLDIGCKSGVILPYRFEGSSSPHFMYILYVTAQSFIFDVICVKIHLALTNEKKTPCNCGNISANVQIDEDVSPVQRLASVMVGWDWLKYID